MIIYFYGKAHPGIIPGSSSISNNIPQTITPIANTTTVQNMKALDLPPNGEVHYFEQKESIAPFNINTQPNTNYFIKLVDHNTGQLALTIFVRGGQNVNIQVPLGSYELRYALGTNWYGEDQLFGPGTAFEKADTILAFYRNGNQVVGNTVSLIRQVNGNMPTTEINKANF